MAATTLDAQGLRDYLGALASSGIGSGLPVFWAVAVLAKQAGTASVEVSLDALGKMTGFTRAQLTAAVKAIRTAGHRVEWHSKEDCTITLNRSKGMKLMAPFMVEPTLDLDMNPILDHLNASAKTGFKMTAKVNGMLRARLRDGLSIDELKHVVDVKVEQWLGDEDMQKFLRPSTLFGPKALEYANERLKGDIKQERVASKEDLSRMWAG